MTTTHTTTLEVLPQKFKHLRELAKTINDRQEEILAEKDKLGGLANSLACNLRLQGLDLIRAKKSVEHGLWLDWLEISCPNISPRIAQYCMKLANTNSVSHLNEADTWGELRDVMKAESSSVTKAEKPWPGAPYLRNLQILQRWAMSLKNAPLEDCKESILERYRVLLEPIARLLWPERFV